MADLTTDIERLIDLSEQLVKMCEVAKLPTNEFWELNKKYWETIALNNLEDEINGKILRQETTEE